MPKYYGLRKKNKRWRQERSLKGVQAKARIHMESEPPDYPIDRKDDYRIINIEDSLQGDHILLLTPYKHHCNQFHVWLDTEYQGIMGWKRAYTLAGQQFCRVHG